MATVYVLIREDWESKEGLRLLSFELLGVFTRYSTGGYKLQTLTEEQARREKGESEFNCDTAFGLMVGRIVDPDETLCSSTCPVWKLFPQEITE